MVGGDGLSGSGHLLHLGDFDAEDVEAEVEAFRGNLVTTFTALWGETATVAFDYELSKVPSAEPQ